MDALFRQFDKDQCLSNFNEVERGYTAYTGFILSDCPSICPSVDRIVSALYHLLDPLHIYTSYQATSEGVSHICFFFNIKNLKFCEIL